MTIVTRFPPSPTGFMHIGTARTALFNWLFARGQKGKMLFRIEDTDRERFKPEYVDAIIDGIKWLGLDWDGEIVSQFEARGRHAEVAHELLKQGKAYYCYCSPEELEAMREKAKAEGSPTFYDRRWRDSKETPPAGVKPVIRIKAPLEGESVVHDKVQGDVTVENKQLDDFVLLRSDGTPTYMLSVVVDDHDMGVSHVVRGDDHLNNTFRQNLIYIAMGWQLPTYAHIPLILGPDGTKLSKRHGAASVFDYRDMGYLPEAMVNYLARLGWSHGDEEIFSVEQAREWFTLEKIGKNPARLDFDKLNSVNAHYMLQADNARLVTLTAELLTRRGVNVSDEAKTRMLKLMDELKHRNKNLVQLADETVFLTKETPLDFDDKAKEILTPEAKQNLKKIAEVIQTIGDFTAPSIEAAIKSFANENGLKMGQVGMPLRAALTGRGTSPSIFHIMEILGKDEILKRLS
ncbi:MAG: glutamate--tRNA ligase [Alphaproteobacteria bacterium]|nr:glutamate--tRNA ligase [Alphaproteobacteria bacterium]